MENKHIKKLEDYKNIIFDLGGVILNLDYNKTVEEFKKHLPKLEEATFFGKENQLRFFSDYEVGKIRSTTFKEEFNRYYGLELTEEQFADCWNAMIFDFPIQRILLIEQLKKLGKKVFLLSNINELHEEAVEVSFSRLNLEMKFSDLFNKVYYSHRIGLRKPNHEIYELVINENGLKKSETLFIDDSLHHVLGARSYGIDSYHLAKPQTIESLSIFNY